MNLFGYRSHTHTHTLPASLPAAPIAPAPEATRAVQQAANTRKPRHTGVLYPNVYAWFVLLASLDIMLTYMILHPLFFSHDAGGLYPRGVEANALANEVIRRWDVPGMVLYKFALVLLVVLFCEIIGRRKTAAGRRLAEWAVFITTIPVVMALVQMGLDLYYWFFPPL